MATLRIEDIEKSAFAQLAKKTGISRDTLRNIFTGETQEVSFEKLFKICHAIETPLVVVEMLMFKDEDTDFADKILYYDPAKGDILPAADVDPDQLPVPETVVAAAEAVAAADKPPEPAPPSKTTEEHIAFLQTHIDRLTSLLELAISSKG